MAEKRSYYVSVAGVLGSGKTTACRLLATALGFHLFEENVSETVFLPKFYKDPHRWALHSQLFYVREKADQLKRIKTLLENSSVVQDSPLYQDYLTYAKAQHHLGHMTDEEFVLYEKIFHVLNRDLPAPDLIIQLDASPEVTHSRIARRGRAYEQSIGLPYIALLTELQKKWLKENSYLNILSVDTNTLDLAANPKHKNQFIETVRERLNI